METARKKSCPCIVPEIETIANADGDSINVFQATPKTYATDIVGSIGSQ
jgi:hypothetical protein